METTELIQKEKLPELHFSRVDVLNSREDWRKRNQDLFFALHLGNIEHTKVKIFFLTDLGYQNLVETTIWAVTEESVCLKGCLYIPIKAILKIEF